jgi:hypothetical protein
MKLLGYDISRRQLFELRSKTILVECQVGTAMAASEVVAPIALACTVNLATAI